MKYREYVLVIISVIVVNLNMKSHLIAHSFHHRNELVLHELTDETGLQQIKQSSVCSQTTEAKEPYVPDYTKRREACSSMTSSRKRFANGNNKNRCNHEGKGKACTSSFRTEGMEGPDG